MLDTPSPDGLGQCYTMQLPTKHVNLWYIFCNCLEVLFEIFKATGNFVPMSGFLGDDCRKTFSQAFDSSQD